MTDDEVRAAIKSAVVRGPEAVFAELITSRLKGALAEPEFQFMHIGVYTQLTVTWNQQTMGRWDKHPTRLFCRVMCPYEFPARYIV